MELDLLQKYEKWGKEKKRGRVLLTTSSYLAVCCVAKELPCVCVWAQSHLLCIHRTLNSNGCTVWDRFTRISSNFDKSNSGKMTFLFQPHSWLFNVSTERAEGAPTERFGF